VRLETFRDTANGLFYVYRHYMVGDLAEFELGFVEILGDQRKNRVAID